MLGICSNKTQMRNKTCLSYDSSHTRRLQMQLMNDVINNAACVLYFHHLVRTSSWNLINFHDQFKSFFSSSFACVKLSFRVRLCAAPYMCNRCQRTDGTALFNICSYNRFLFCVRFTGFSCSCSLLLRLCCAWIQSCSSSGAILSASMHREGYFNFSFPIFHHIVLLLFVPFISYFKLISLEGSSCEKLSHSCDESHYWVCKPSCSCIFIIFFDDIAHNGELQYGARFKIENYIFADYLRIVTSLLKPLHQITWRRSFQEYF